MSFIMTSPHPLSAARWRGLRVGLLGGSFNPAHEGHMHIAKAALIRFRLDAIWWVVSPGNPLKTKNVKGDLNKRVAQVSAFVTHPRMVVTDIEGKLGTRYTHDTLRRLKTLFPTTKFIWVAGMDNACAFDKWDGWATLPDLVPFVFFDRPPAAAKIKGKKVRANRKIRQRTKVMTHRTKTGETGVFWMFKGRAVNLSSTALRRNFAGPRDSGV